MFSYGQRSKCADLLNSYHIFFILKSLKEKVKDKGGREYEEGMEDCSGGIDYIIAVFDFF